MIRPIIAALFGVLALAACKPTEAPNSEAAHGEAPGAEFPRGPHRGRLLSDGSFAIELAIFESGVPPEYHAWPTLNGKPVPLDQVELAVELTRLDGEIDRFSFTPKEDFLRGSDTVHEPHSFDVKVTAIHAGESHEWKFASYEGRTTIAADIADAAGIQVETAGPATLVTTLKLYGQIAADPARQREVAARYPGLIQTVHKSLGESVRAGETLAVIESNDSLRSYNLTSPIAGVITQRNANPGEQSGERTLFTIVDQSSVIAQLSVFPADRSRIRIGAPVQVEAADGAARTAGKIERLELQTANNQSVIARATLENASGQFLPGTFITAQAQIATRQVPLAVKTVGLQPFRDFTVVFQRVENTYEVRMLELGETQGEWAEVLGGLKAGAQYVTQNSYLIKADVEKAGASHDH